MSNLATQSKALALLAKIKAERELKLAKEAASQVETDKPVSSVPTEAQSNSTSGQTSLSVAEKAALQDIKDKLEAEAGKPVSPVAALLNALKEEQATKQATSLAAKSSFNLTLNAKQKEFIALASDFTLASPKRIILTGAAGTGKTTAVKGLIQQYKVMNQLGGFPVMEESTKYLIRGELGLSANAYTNKAVANVKRLMDKDIKPHCITIHKLLQFQPVFYEVWDPSSHSTKKTMRFEPTYNADNKLPASLKVVIIDEASMVSTAGEGPEGYKENEFTGRKEPIALFEMLQAALRPSTKIIFIGDIQQLPPVFGDSILGHSLLKVPTVELTEVYRQALDSPIIGFAWNILKGEAFLFPSLMKVDPSDPSGKRKINPAFQRFEAQAKGVIKLVPWQRKLSADAALQQASNFLINLAENGGYLPDEDAILIPFNVNFGQIELNKHLANRFGKKRNALVYEVISGINKRYLAVGDKVLFNKEEFKIIEINRNAQYLGQEPQSPSTNLDRWGAYQGTSEEHHLDEMAGARSYSEADIDAYLEAAAGATSEERFNHASHTITIQNMADEGIVETLGTAGEVNNLDLGYAMTVHKSQGSEYRKVFILFHHTHAVMMFRELLYTAVTRAREELVIICEADSIQKCISNPRIKGNTIEEKAAFFNKRIERKAATKAALSNMNLDLS